MTSLAAGNPFTYSILGAKHWAKSNKWDLIYWLKKDEKTEQKFISVGEMSFRSQFHNDYVYLSTYAESFEKIESGHFQR